MLWTKTLLIIQSNAYRLALYSFMSLNKVYIIFATRFHLHMFYIYLENYID